MSASRPSLWQSLMAPLTGRSRPAPPDYDDWPELKAKLDAAMPTIERGKDWLRAEIAGMPAEQDFYDRHRDLLLGAAPALSHSALTAWMSLIDEPAWRERLQPDQIILLLGAVLVWQVAAAERSLKRQGALVSDLNVVFSTRVLEEAIAYLEREGVSQGILSDIRQQSAEANLLYPFAVDALEPEEGDAASELVAATSRFADTEALEGFAGGLSGAWMIMDVAAIAVLYRSFGKHLQDQAA